MVWQQRKEEEMLGEEVRGGDRIGSNGRRTMVRTAKVWLGSAAQDRLDWIARERSGSVGVAVM